MGTLFLRLGFALSPSEDPDPDLDAGPRGTPKSRVKAEAGAKESDRTYDKRW